MTAVSLSVQPKIFSDRETAISCLYWRSVLQFTFHRVMRYYTVFNIYNRRPFVADDSFFCRFVVLVVDRR